MFSDAIISRELLWHSKMQTIIVGQKDTRLHLFILNLRITIFIVIEKSFEFENIEVQNKQNWQSDLSFQFISSVSPPYFAI